MQSERGKVDLSSPLSSPHHGRPHQLTGAPSGHFLSEETVTSELRVHVRHKYVAEQHALPWFAFVGGGRTLSDTE